jgi:hypothetical protein
VVQSEADQVRSRVVALKNARYVPAGCTTR